MKFKAHRKQLLLAGPLIAAAVTITACGGGGASAPTQGSAPGHWSQAEISEFMVGAGSDGVSSCEAGYIEQDMSFGNAMDLGSVSSNFNSVPQAKTVLTAKYGTAEGDAIDGQFLQAVDDVAANCSD
jgi:hypothetical protein